MAKFRLYIYKVLNTFIIVLLDNGIMVIKDLYYADFRLEATAIYSV